MKAIFRTSPRMNNENQNNVMIRKPAKITRKPLVDRKVVQPIAPKQQNKETKNKYLEMYTCSYKDIPDNYSDLKGQPELSNFSSIDFTNQKTPPPQRFDKFEPELIDDSDIFNYKFVLDEKFDDFQIYDIDDVPLPELNFEF